MNYKGYTANQLYMFAMRDLRTANIVEGRDEPTREHTHVMFELSNPRNRLLSMRDINPAFAWVEVLWIMAGGNSVKYLEFWNKRMWDYADKETGLLHGAYGHRLGCHWFWLNGRMEYSFTDPVSNSLYTEPVDFKCTSQVYRALGILSNKASSRQVVLQIWDEETDMPMWDGTERAPDIPCNLLSHLLVRQGKLEWLQIMRSNDAIWGWPYNIIQWTFLQEIMAGWLEIEPGSFNLVSDSFHIYKRHWDKFTPILERFDDFRSIDITRPNDTIKFHSQSYALPFEEWQRSFRVMIETAYALTECPLGEEQDLVMSIFNVCNLEYLPLMGMLAAEATRIKSAELEPVDRGISVANALNISNDLMISDPYWHAAWKRWAIAKETGVVL